MRPTRELCSVGNAPGLKRRMSARFIPRRGYPAIPKIVLLVSNVRVDHQPPTTLHSTRIVRYHADVLRSPFRLLVLLMAVAGCHSTSPGCGSIEASNRVVIHENGHLPDRDITDPVQIASLTVFANARRNCSNPTTYTMPAPQTNAIFYRDSAYLGALGAGSNFFFVACPRGSGLRPASADELATFARLLSHPQ